MSSIYIVIFVNIRNISTKILPYNNIRYVGGLNYSDLYEWKSHDIICRYFSKVDFFGRQLKLNRPSDNVKTAVI